MKRPKSVQFYDPLLFYTSPMIVCWFVLYKKLNADMNTYTTVEMENKSLDEAIIDRLLLLYLAARTRDKGYNILGHIKLQKLLYKTQERLNTARIKGLNYSFIRWKFGPFSQEIYSDVEDLKACGFLIPEDISSVSDKGRRLLKSLDRVFDKDTKEIIEKVLNEFGPYTGRQIKAIMYGSPVVGKNKTIKDAEMGELLLTRLQKSDVKSTITIDEGTMDTLRFIFDPHSNNALEKGLKALKTERCKPFIPVGQ